MAAKRILSLMRADWQIPQLKRLAQFDLQAAILICPGWTSPVLPRQESAGTQVLFSQTPLQRPAKQSLAGPHYSTFHQASWQGSETTSCAQLTNDFRIPCSVAAQDLSEETDIRASFGQSPIHNPNDHHWLHSDRANLHCTRSVGAIRSDGGPLAVALWKKSAGHKFHTRSWWKQKWFTKRCQAAGLSTPGLDDDGGRQVPRQSSWAVGRYESTQATQAKPPLHVFPGAFNAPRTPPPTAAEIQKQVVVDHSEHAVNVALMINGVVFCGKLLVYFWTSSDVMLAEAVHSLADIANQALLAYGIYLSRRAPDKWHPYGYGKDRFIWALISATGIFCCGAGINIVHGFHCLMAPEPVANIGLGLAVLGASGLAEGGSFWVAYKAVRDSAKAENMPTLKYLWAGLDPTAVAVLMEDGAAVIGLGVAALALVATHATGNPVYDAIGSIGVGVLLGGVAAFLIQRNRSALLGRSMDEHEMQELMHLLKADPVVHAIYDAKSEVIGPGEFRFKAEIDFRGHVVVRHFLQRAGHRQVLDHFEKALANNSDKAVEEALEQYGTAIVQSIGDEVDRLEQVIQRKVPEMRHVDIEVHSRFGKSAYR